MKLIKLIEIIGYGVVSLVTWWAGISAFFEKPKQSVIDSYSGAVTFFGVLSIIIAICLSYIAYRKWSEYRAGDFN